MVERCHNTQGYWPIACQPLRNSRNSRVFRVDACWSGRRQLENWRKSGKWTGLEVRLRPSYFVTPASSIAADLRPYVRASPAPYLVTRYARRAVRPQRNRRTGVAGFLFRLGHRRAFPPTRRRWTAPFPTGRPATRSLLDAGRCAWSRDQGRRRRPAASADRRGGVLDSPRERP